MGKSGDCGVCSCWCCCYRCGPAVSHRHGSSASRGKCDTCGCAGTDYLWTRGCCNYGNWIYGYHYIKIFSFAITAFRGNGVGCCLDCVCVVSQHLRDGCYVRSRKGSYQADVTWHHCPRVVCSCWDDVPIAVSRSYYERAP